MIKRWNYKTHDYDAYEPKFKDELHLRPVEMEEKVTCAQCGKSVDFGTAYTSKVIHSEAGFGYPVCPDCHDNEFQLERAYREEKND